MSDKIFNRILIIIVFIGVIIGVYILPKFYNAKTERASESGIKDFKGGEYLQLVYIGSEGCSYCNDSLHNELKSLKMRVRSFAKAKGIGFFSTGISTDIDSKVGYDFLTKSGYFDEVIAGGGWYNLGSQYYIWSEFNLEGYVPQVLIVYNMFHVDASLEGILNIERNDTLLYRLDSYKEVKAFDTSSLDALVISKKL